MAVFLYQWLFLSVFSLFSNGEKKNPAGAPHPFYIAVTEINQNPKEKNLEISIKVFADDLEQIMEQHAHQNFDLTSEKQKPQLDKLVAEYFVKNLSINIDGKPQKLSYIGFEKEKESAYGYFEIDNVTSIKRIDITNTILQDFNNTQINIIHAVVNGKRQSTKLDFPARQASFTW